MKRASSRRRPPASSPSRAPLPRPSRMRSGGQKCRGCDCTAARGCVVGCGWAEPGLCTACKALEDRILVYCQRYEGAPPLLRDILDVFAQVVRDYLEDLDDRRTRRCAFDLIAYGFLRLDREKRYLLTKAGEKRLANIARAAKRRKAAA